MNKLLVLKPRMSEKAYGLSKSHGRYVFDVPKSANKLEIAAAVSAEFKVIVTDVNTTTVKGKTRVRYQKRSRPSRGTQSDTKRAYVTLKKGDHIPIYAAIDDAESKEKAATAKAATAKGAKEEKK